MSPSPLPRGARGGARAVRMACLLLVLAGAGACVSGEDAADAVQALQPGGPPDEYPVMQNSELPFRYPPALYDQRVQANVTLRLFIDSLGRVVMDSTRVEESSGYQQLDSAAVTGSQALRFTPARRDGQPIAVSALFPIHFRHPEAPPMAADTTNQGTGNREQGTAP